MLWAPLSEVNFIGRSPIYASTFVAFVGFSILAATTQSWSGFLAIRFLQGFFGSPCLAIGGASMHDLFPDLTVPYSLTVWVAAAYCGPALGPLLAGYLVPVKGWRYGMWEIVWLAAPTHCTDVDITGNPRANHKSTTSLRNRAKIDTLQ
jgi:DHA1 family multidrug resistance protein-like MFS transporter